MAVKLRQIRRGAIIIGFFAALFLIYLAGLSTSYQCEEGADGDCNQRLRTGVEIKKEKLPAEDDTKREVQMLVEEGQIVKRSYKEEEIPDSLKNKKRNNFQRRIKENKNNKKDLDLGIYDSLNDVSSKKLRYKTRPKKVVTLSNDIRNFEVNSMFIQIKEADSPRVGDFACSATVVPDCCAFTVSDTNEAKRICEAFGKLCKGFVMSTISSKVDTFEYVMYLKRDLNGTMANYLTDFFIKVDHLNELRWNEQRR
eukprot:Seg758.4 transcript_id=Seg758.4/GoldUCD/mRNA.D3Y31 product="hypothetical protein" protein_id=Seg758.4/GoldUCD/D3Y31